MLALLKVGVQITYLKKKKKQKKTQRNKTKPPKIKPNNKKVVYDIIRKIFFKKKNSYQCI
jgi:hypothetical protein